MLMFVFSLFCCVGEAAETIMRNGKAAATSKGAAREMQQGFTKQPHGRIGVLGGVDHRFRRVGKSALCIITIMRASRAKTGSQVKR